VETSVPMAGDRAVTGRRVAPRARVALPARLETLHGIAPALIRNLSETGAMIQLTGPTTVGADGVLSFAGQESFGTVQWVKSQWCGFAFDERLPQATVISLRSASDNGVPAAAAQAKMNDIARGWSQGRQR
jgi:hypothetical protein